MQESQQLAMLLELEELYFKQSCGVHFIDIKPIDTKPNVILDNNLADTIRHCHLCTRSKIAKPTIGYNIPNSKIIFIVETPMGDGNVLFDSKASQMICNIAKNIFNQESFSVFSLLKCGNQEIIDEQIALCKPYLITQTKQSQAQKVVIFGERIADAVLGLNASHKGVILDLYGKKAVVTYSILQLLRNPSLKKEAMKHFLILK